MNNNIRTQHTIINQSICPDDCFNTRYHSRIHAADVLRSYHTVLTRGGVLSQVVMCAQAREDAKHPQDSGDRPSVQMSQHQLDSSIHVSIRVDWGSRLGKPIGGYSNLAVLGHLRELNLILSLGFYIIHDFITEYLSGSVITV